MAQCRRCEVYSWVSPSPFFPEPTRGPASRADRSTRRASRTTLRHVDGQTKTESSAGDVGHDDGPADGRESSLLLTSESIVARARIPRVRQGPVRRFLRRNDGPARLTARHLFRLLLIGYFEGIDSERGIAWRAADSLALRDFLGVCLEEAPADHSTV